MEGTSTARAWRGYLGPHRAACRVHVGKVRAKGRSGGVCCLTGELTASRGQLSCEAPSRRSPLGAATPRRRGAAVAAWLTLAVPLISG
jgi:hypothetical protein